MSYSNVRRTGAIVALAALVLSPFAFASFTTSFTASFHGQPCTEYAQWESFTQPDTNPNAPDDPSTTSFDSALIQLVPGAIITAQGNIDHLTQPPQYRITDSVPGDLQEVVLQVSNNLNPMNWNSAMLTYTDGGGMPQSIAPTQSTYLLHLMGHDERLLTWDLTGIADVILSYRIDFAANNPSTTLDALKLDTRYACTPGVVFCAGDGTGVACPCTNGTAGHGCDNSFATGGGSLGANGIASLSNDTLVLVASSLPPTTSALFFQGDAPINGGLGVVFGDGQRCAGGSVIRLGTKTTSGGTASYGHGIGTDPDISVHGMIPITGGTRYYQAWYRNAATYCTAATFNLTNGLSLTW